jgi:Nas2 N_terminal domain
MEQARALITRKENIEAEIEAQISVLKANSSTLQSPLLDQDGFPRADIDIFAVRGARVRIIELRNDLDAVTNAIGKALEGIYDPSLQVGRETTAPEDTHPKPFAKLNGVAPGSPAAEAVRTCIRVECLWLTMMLAGPSTRRSSLEVWSPGSSVVLFVFPAAFGRSSCVERECGRSLWSLLYLL